MERLEELKSAYKKISDEYDLMFTEYEEDEVDGDKFGKFVFTYFAVGIRMRIEYEFIVDGDPINDDIMVYGDPYAHFSIHCWRAVTEFINTLQRNRTDKDIMYEFIKYMREEYEAIR